LKNCVAKGVERGLFQKSGARAEIIYVASAIGFWMVRKRDKKKKKRRQKEEMRNWWQEIAQCFLQQCKKWNTT